MVNKPISRPAETAVTIRNAYKTFKSSGSKATKVLEKFSMTVPAGKLYSLIGSSGCGKTTVLSCLVGIQKLDYGRLSVFGSKTVPISSNRWQRIGYMPQEISLYNDFSIFETLIYFGTLFDTGREHTRRSYLLGRVDFLRELLRLPHIDRIVGTLSGGQRRRVSFAVALIHEPELLLLDEPSAGIDPLIRECIWEHLNFLCAKKSTTIIITTHFIDEAKNSDMVGIMRDGRLVAEDTPGSLMEQYQTNSLETVFFEICKQQEAGNYNNSPIMATVTSPDRLSGLSDTYLNRKERPFQHKRSTFPVTRSIKDSIRRVKALVGKNFRNIARSPWLLSFYTIIPALCMYVTCATFQQDVHDISLGVVNYDVMDSGQCFQQNSSYEDATCEFDHLSCNFLKEIPSKVFILKYFESASKAREAVKQGLIWGYINFPENYTRGVMNRAFNGLEEIDEGDDAGLRLWNSSKITVNLDQSNTLILANIVRTLLTTFERSTMKILSDCGFDERNGQSPLQYGDPILGSSPGKTQSVLDHVAPGLAICILFFFPVTCSVRIIGERRQGILERCLAAGTKIWEVLLAHAIFETVIIFIQSSLVFIILHYIYSIGPAPSEDPITFLLILAICILTGLSSLAWGFMLGASCSEESQAALTEIALTIPNTFLSGCLWPVEGMPEILKIITPLLPMTLPGETLRSLMVRRWEIDHPRVWPGFMVTALYILGFCLITIFLLRRRS